jgi:hypothetical protein
MRKGCVWNTYAESSGLGSSPSVDERYTDFCAACGLCSFQTSLLRADGEISFAATLDRMCMRNMWLYLRGAEQRRERVCIQSRGEIVLQFCVLKVSYTRA